MKNNISSLHQGRMSQKLLRQVGLVFTIVFVFFLIYFLNLRHIDNNQIDSALIDSYQNKVEDIKTNPSITPKVNIISENILPKNHLIKTAFIPQAPEKNWDQPWQDACEEAALLTAFYYYKDINPSIDDMKNKILEIIKYEEDNGWGTSINILKIQQIYNDYLNLKSDIIIDPKIDDIKKSLVNGHLILIPSAGKMLFEENKYFNDGGPQYHALVVLGYDENKKEFIVHDVGTKHGAYFKYSYQLLMDSIHDFPESNKSQDILSGSKKVLVLKNNEN